MASVELHRITTYLHLRWYPSQKAPADTALKAVKLEMKVARSALQSVTKVCILDPKLLVLAGRTLRCAIVCFCVAGTNPAFGEVGELGEAEQGWLGCSVRED